MLNIFLTKEREDLEVNVTALYTLLKEKFNNNQSLMAKALGVSKNQLNIVLKKHKGAGADFCGAIIKWCECNGVYYKDYIFLK